MPRKRIASAVLFVDGNGRMLLVEPTYKDVWELPGGAVEADESPRDAAAREVLEELGIVTSPGRLIAVDWVPPQDGRAEGVVFVYDGGRMSTEQDALITLAHDELRSRRWCTVAEAQERMRPLVARRVAASVEAVRSGSIAELHDGYPVRGGSAC